MRNYQILKLELVEAVTAGKSTTALSRKLGYSFDQVRRWTNGTKHLRWDEFCELCDATKVPLSPILRDLFGMAAQKKKDAFKIVAALKVFSRKKTIAVLAKDLGVSLAVMKRYIAGETYPDVELVLEMIDMRDGFLESFVDSVKNPSTDSNSIFSLPWIATVSGALAQTEHLALPSYSPAWIARRLALSEKQVEDAVKIMCEAGLIEKKESGHYGPTLSRTLALSSRINPQEFARTMRFWTKRAGDRYATTDGTPASGATSSATPGASAEDMDRGFFRCFATDPATAKKVSEIISRAEQDIHEALTTAKGDRTEIRTIVLHHFDAGAVS